MQRDELGRREFISVLGGAAAWPLTARAQQLAMPVIGILSGGSAAGYAPIAAAFRQGLTDAGYIEGQNVTIEYRWAEGQYDRLPALAADLVARKVAVIAAAGGIGSALAAKAATPTIPIVFVTGDDPMNFGLVDSFNRPGGNVTGVSFLLPALEAKCLELLHELIPKAILIAVLVNPSFAAADLRVIAVREAADTLGLQLSMLKARAANATSTMRLRLLWKSRPAHSSLPPIRFLSVDANKLCSWQNAGQYRQPTLRASSPLLVV